MFSNGPTIIANLWTEQAGHRICCCVPDMTRMNRGNRRNDDERCNYDGTLHTYGHDIRPREERPSIHARIGAARTAMKGLAQLLLPYPQESWTGGRQLHTLRKLLQQTGRVQGVGSRALFALF